MFNLIERDLEKMDGGCLEINYLLLALVMQQQRMI